MNWTGGRLQRHSRNAGSGAINRQKQHFAKVRTQLQNGSAQHTTPFRPSFLQEVDVSLGRKLPPFRDRSSGRVGYSKRLQISVHYDKKLNSQGDQFGKMSAFPKLTDNSRYDFEGITRRSPGLTARTNRQENSRRKREAAEPLSEEHFLEANKRKLLGRRDWVGLAPSRPVHVHFQSCKEKERIGKRRRINSRPLPQDGDMMTRHFLRDTEINARGLFMSGAIVTDLEDIRIRIGTDALSNQLPSDPMLFDVFDAAHSCKAHSGSAETIGSSIMGPHARNKTALQESWRSASARPLCSGQHERKFIFSDCGELRLAQDLKKNKDDDLGIHGGTGGAPVATASVKEGQQDYLDPFPKNTHAKKQLRTLPCPFRSGFPSSPFGLSAASPQGVSQGNCAATDLSSNASATYLDGGDCQKMDVAGVENILGHF